jgi:NADPH2:quinone reductase
VTLGAEAGIDHTTQDVKAEIKRLTVRGADVVVDPVGGPLAEASLRAMAYGGRFVTVGYASGDIPRIPLNLVLLKGVTIQGMELRSLYGHHPEAEAAAAAALDTLVADGMTPHVSRVLPLADAVEALEDVAQRRVQGKVVLDLQA